MLIFSVFPILLLHFRQPLLQFALLAVVFSLKSGKSRLQIIHHIVCEQNCLRLTPKCSLPFGEIRLVYLETREEKAYLQSLAFRCHQDYRFCRPCPWQFPVLLEPGWKHLHLEGRPSSKSGILSSSNFAWLPDSRQGLSTSRVWLGRTNPSSPGYGHWQFGDCRFCFLQGHMDCGITWLSGFPPDFRLIRWEWKWFGGGRMMSHFGGFVTAFCLASHWWSQVDSGKLVIWPNLQVQNDFTNLQCQGCWLHQKRCLRSVLPAPSSHRRQQHWAVLALLCTSPSQRHLSDICSHQGWRPDLKMAKMCFSIFQLLFELNLGLTGAYL